MGTSQGGWRRHLLRGARPAAPPGTGPAGVEPGGTAPGEAEPAEGGPEERPPEEQSPEEARPGEARPGEQEPEGFAPTAAAGAVQDAAREPAQRHARPKDANRDGNQTDEDAPDQADAETALRGRAAPATARPYAATAPSAAPRGLAPHPAEVPAPPPDGVPWPGSPAPAPVPAGRPPATARPDVGAGGGWPPDGSVLLLDLLLLVDRLSRREARFDLLAQMDRAAGPFPLGEAGFAAEVAEGQDARAHLRALVAAVRSRRDPAAALDALRAGLRALAPHDRTLPWLELTVLGLAGDAPLDAAAVLALVRVLHPVGELPPGHGPTPAQLARHIPRGLPGTHLLTGGETLPEILLRLSDLRAPRGPAPLLGFLAGLADDRELPAHSALDALRALLRERAAAGAPAGSEQARGRLIVQIRVEAVDPEHVEDGRYELRGAYYRQPPDGGPLVRLGSLPPSGPLRRSELTGAGSARLAAWTELAREVRGASGGVRVEFLLPTGLLGHRAEVWSAGASRTPMGHHHPVVVRSLERYVDPWIQDPWRRRWQGLCEDPAETEPLARIAWPPLDGLTAWLGSRPDWACLGLEAPYDELAAGAREAVRDALFMEGVPVMVWRRDGGDPREIVTALRPHAPARLRDLPESVHHCRRHGRTAGEGDVRNNITLLWDDPDCVDADQDLPFAGMG